MKSGLKTPEQSLVVMTEMVLPQHTNALGSIFGGVVMSWVDIAAATCAMRHAGKQVVTASIDSMHFLAPIRLGWIVTIKALMHHVFASSCEIGVRVSSENPLTGESFHNATAYLTFVALDSHGKPASMPGLDMSAPISKRRSESAIERREARLELKKKMATKIKDESSF